MYLHYTGVGSCYIYLIQVFPEPSDPRCEEGSCLIALSKGQRVGDPFSTANMHIGHRIKQIIDRQPKERTVTWFARQLHCDRRNIYHIFDRSTIDTELLRRISLILDHNFFQDLADDTFPSPGGIKQPGDGV